MNSTGTALAQLDTDNGAAVDGDMDAELTLMRQEMGAGFKEVQFRWLMGLLVTLLLGIGGLDARLV